VDQSIETFDADAFRNQIAAQMGVAPWEVTIYARPGSVVVTVAFTTTNMTAAALASSAIESLTPSALSAATGVTIVGLGPTTLETVPVSGPSPPPPTSPPPSPPPPSLPPASPPPWWEAPCPSGFEQTAPAGACVMCEAGKYQASGSGAFQECRPCERGDLQPEPGQTSCIECPPEGINCNRRDTIDILPGFYASDSSPISAQQLLAWQCPNPFGCAGGTSRGNSSCATGHTGVFCSICELGYFMNRRTCEACEADESNASTTVITTFAVVGSIALLLFICFTSYLCNGEALEEREFDRERAMRKSEQRPSRWSRLTRSSRSSR
jgi:hypothetical protein